MKRTIALIIVGIIILSFNSKAQNKKDSLPKQTSGTSSTIKQKITDSTAVISLRDMQTFNSWLMKTYSYEAYIKFKPEDVLSLLYNWKLKQKD